MIAGAKHSIIFSLCISIVLGLSGCSHQQKDSKGRPVISDAERALAMLQIENTFSKHAYYHQINRQCDEMRDIWVAEDGPYSSTAKWTLAGNVMQGIPMIKLDYCTINLEGQKQTLEELSKKVPSVKNIPENVGAGSEHTMHTQETPVIEVAGDGKTAKGIWYSIGMSARGVVADDGKTSVVTSWMWERYGVDFIKENGAWKIWHLMNLMDQAPVEAGAKSQGGPGGPGGADRAPGGAGKTPGGKAGPLSGGMGPVGSGEMKYAGRVDSYSWSPIVVPKIEPRFPEPYYTFSETFSY